MTDKSFVYQINQRLFEETGIRKDYIYYMHYVITLFFFWGPTSQFRTKTKRISKHDSLDE